MTNMNIYWTLCETVFKWRKSWYVPEPEPRVETVHQELVRKFHTPGALIPIDQDLSPYGALLKCINKQKEDDLEYIDKNLMEGLFYGTNWEKESQEADIQAEKAFEEAKEDDSDTFKMQSRLQSLYGTMQRAEPHVYWTPEQIYKTPIRVDSDDQES